MNSRRSIALVVLSLTACAPEVTPPPPPADGLAADLQFLREEEKLARDVYLTLYERWQLRPHQNIASSEQSHTDRVKSTLAALSIDDPVRDDGVGVFVNADLAALFAQLVQEGSVSQVESLRVGAVIEDLDLRDLATLSARTTDPLALATYEPLACGSRNHLRAFTSQLEARGVTYAPAFISAAHFDAIVTSPSESCGGR